MDTKSIILHVNEKVILFKFGRIDEIFNNKFYVRNVKKNKQKN